MSTATQATENGIFVGMFFTLADPWRSKDIYSVQAVFPYSINICVVLTTLNLLYLNVCVFLSGDKFLKGRLLILYSLSVFIKHVTR